MILISALFLEIRLRDYLAVITGLSKDVNDNGLSRARHTQREELFWVAPHF